MDGRKFAAAVAVATPLIGLLVLLHGCLPCAAARPLAQEPSSVRLALAPAPAPASDEAAGAAWPMWRRADAAARAGKWLPFAGRYPALWGLPSAGSRLVPWAAAAPPALVFRTGGQLVRQPREEEDAAARQEQVAMWASLLNPTAQTQVGPAATTWPMAGNGEARPADAEPSSGEGAEDVSVPASGGVLISQPLWPAGAP